jgi:methionyl aminopeptidase
MSKTLENGINIYSDLERLKIEKAATTAYKVLTEVISNTQEGITTLELNAITESLIKKYKGQPLFKGYNGFPFSACLSVNNQIVHGLANNRKLRNGDIISIDIGVRLDGYCGDNARTILIGDNYIELDKKLVDIAEEACLMATKEAFPGNTTGDIGYTINRTILSSYINNDVNSGRNFKVYDSVFGHGIGKDLHEKPNVPNIGYKNHGVTLYEGMCICIEPVILYNSSIPMVIMNSEFLIEEFFTSDGKPTSHFENQIFITKEGPILLTRI